MTTTRQIADMLRLVALEYPDGVEPRERVVVLRVDGLTIRCMPSREAVQAVADKYARGPVKRTATSARRYYGGQRGGRGMTPVTAKGATTVYAL